MHEERRLAELERRLVKIEDRTENMGVTSNEIQNLWQAIRQVRDELVSLRKAQYTAALTVTAGVLITALMLVFR